ncbi:MAG: hypothetical protein WC472_03265 [Candidatus Paceibacterota bacterium]
MKIIFNYLGFPEKSNIIRAIDDYEKIWKEEGTLIIEKIQTHSGMKFVVEEIQAYVHEDKSQSHPLLLRASYSYEFKKATLIHELLHIILVDNKIKYKDPLTTHIELDKYYYDILMDMYGKKFLNMVIQKESGFGGMYKQAWEVIKKEKQIIELRGS